MFVSLDGRQETLKGYVSPEQSQHHPATNASQTSPYRVLLVDDDEVTRHLLQDILEKHTDIKIVGHAGDGREAVVRAIEHKPDVILMDIGLPFLDGIEATHCIKKSCPDTVIICLTGHFSPPKYSAMRTAGAAAFVCKNQLLAIHEMIMCALGHWKDLAE